jgi:hypothetical protein
MGDAAAGEVDGGGRIEGAREDGSGGRIGFLLDEDYVILWA